MALTAPPAVMRRGSYDEAAASIRPHLRNLAQRRRSAPSLVFGKVLGMPCSPIREEAHCLVAVEQCPFVLGLTSDTSLLALHECVQLTEGQKTHERYLFLFSEVLVIAKLKSSVSYRLKHRVSLEQLWLYGFEDEREEDVEVMGIEVRTSLALVWPMALCIVTFSSPEVKERWADTLHRKIIKAQQKSGFSSPPSNILMKVLSSNITNKTLIGGAMEPHVESPPIGDAKVSAQPRHSANTKEPFENGCNKFTLITRKLRKSCAPTNSNHALFGQALHKICSADGALPKPIREILTLLWRKGPATEGVFRRPSNSKTVNIIREQLDAGDEVNMEVLPVALLVGLLKSFLKELPGSLLVAEQCDNWINALEKDEQKRPSELKSVMEKLPQPHVHLLELLICVLHRISQNAKANLMDPKNLAVCIAPTLLQVKGHPKDILAHTAKVNSLTQFLIENCSEIFGEHVLGLLGDPDEEELEGTSDSSSLQQLDSAYDSPDPDAIGCYPAEEEEGLSSSSQKCPTATSSMTDHSLVTSCSSEHIFNTFTKPMGRRCSEPTIFNSEMIHIQPGLARSQDDFTKDREDFLQLKKQISDDSFLQSKRYMDQPLAPPKALAAKDCSFSSSGSLESGTSNHSESSVFTNSPKTSPACSRRSHSTKSVPTSRPTVEMHKPEVEVKWRSKSLRLPGLFNRAGVKKVELQKEAAFSCETLQEDSPSEPENPEEVPARQRPLSEILMPSQPPSYHQAILSGIQTVHPLMTVQNARSLTTRPRPISMNEDFLNSCSLSQGTHFLRHLTDNTDPFVSQPPPPYRQRAMSESVSMGQHERIARRCSQPLVEELSHAKETYV
ncbi:T cell activation RhoGTPase activating protein b isoform X2 [Denticeps clupeoides]|nr:T-cell activation Rho GTPase-activating protein-like isoform X2 [Denticeps clupeoides]